MITAIAACQAAAAAYGLDTTSRAVLAVYADAANMHDGYTEPVCWPSVATTARRAGCHRRSVQRANGRLTRAGLITVAARHHDDGGQQTNLVTLRLTPICHAAGHVGTILRDECNAKTAAGADTTEATSTSATSTAATTATAAATDTAPIEEATMPMPQPRPSIDYDPEDWRTWDGPEDLAPDPDDDTPDYDDPAAAAETVADVQAAPCPDRDYSRIIEEAKVTGASQAEAAAAASIAAGTPPAPSAASPKPRSTRPPTSSTTGSTSAPNTPAHPTPPQTARPPQPPGSRHASTQRTRPKPPRSCPTPPAATPSRPSPATTGPSPAGSTTATRAGSAATSTTPPNAPSQRPSTRPTRPSPPANRPPATSQNSAPSSPAPGRRSTDEAGMALLRRQNLRRGKHLAAPRQPARLCRAVLRHLRHAPGPARMGRPSGGRRRLRLQPHRRPQPRNTLGLPRLHEHRADAILTP